MIPMPGTTSNSRWKPIPSNQGSSSGPRSIGVGNRGARRPVLEKAEDHYYAALHKLEKLKKANRLREYHAIVEDWVQRELTVLYQMDGLPLLPLKAYPQHFERSYAPGVSISSQLRVAKDTRDFFFNNEYRQFTAEKKFAASDVRFGGTRNFDPTGQLNSTQISDIVRAPLRLQLDNALRIRQNLLGTFDCRPLVPQPVGEPGLRLLRPDAVLPPRSPAVLRHPGAAARGRLRARLSAVPAVRSAARGWARVGSGATASSSFTRST